MHIKRIISIALCCAMSLTSLAFADSTVSGVSGSYEKAAVNLYTNGLFKGSADGFELSSSVTKATACVMLVRLLGAEDEALSGSYSLPYTDVPAWANNYVGYLLKKGVIAADKDTIFDSDAVITADEYIVMLLRSLGYEDVSFEFDSNVNFGLSVTDGLLTWDEIEDLTKTSFNRGEMAFISNKALGVKLKGTDGTLLDKLNDEGAIKKVDAPTAEQIYGADASVTGDTIVAASVDGSKIESIARKYIGTRYRSGGKSPSTGFDCSGFTNYVLIQAGVWNQFYGSCDGLKAQTTTVNKAAAKKGDLVFFTGTYSSSHTYTHVGIYLGNGQFIHSSSSNGVIVSSLSDSYWGSHYSCMGRP